MPREYLIIIEIAARRFYEKMTTPHERRLLDEILNDILVDPYPDYDLKSPFAHPPENALIYYDGRFWLIYDVPEMETIRVMNMGFEEEIPTTERDEPLL